MIETSFDDSTRRKEAFEAAKEKNKAGKKANGARATRQAAALETKRTETSISRTVKGKGKALEETRLYVSLSEVKESETCPAVFRVRAHVVDFFPDDLRACTVLRCTSCKETWVSQLSIQPWGAMLTKERTPTGSRRCAGGARSATMRWRMRRSCARSSSFTSASQTSTATRSTCLSLTSGSVFCAQST